MTVIPFPTIKDPLYFDGIAIKFDVEQQRKNFAEIFTSMQFAIRFCSFNRVEAEKAAHTFIAAGDGDLLDNMIAGWAGDIDHLETLVAIIKSAAARVEISKDRALARTRRNP